MLDLGELLDFFSDPLLIMDVILFFFPNLIFSDLSQLLSFHGLEGGGAASEFLIGMEASFGDNLTKHQILYVLFQLKSGLQDF